jgi:hypothetical protein
LLFSTKYKVIQLWPRKLQRRLDRGQQKTKPEVDHSRGFLMVRCFSEDQIRRLLGWDPLIAAMEEALTAFSRGKVIQRCVKC